MTETSRAQRPHKHRWSHLYLQFREHLLTAHMPHASYCWKSPQETWFPIHLIHHQASLLPSREAHSKERDNRCRPSWSASKRALLGELISSRKSHSSVSHIGTLRKCQPCSQHAQSPQSGIPRIPC